MNQHSELSIHDTGVFDILSVNDLPNEELPFPTEFHQNVRDVHINLYTNGFPSLSQYNPTAVALRQEGVDLRTDDDLRAAIGLFRASIEIEPFFVQAHLNLATALFTEGQFAEAELIWRRLSRLSQKSRELRAWSNAWSAQAWDTSTLS